MSDPDRSESGNGGTDPRVGFALSYLKIRKWVGVLGFALPTFLFFLDWVLLKARDLDFRDSLSAYYYSGARDVFVGTLGIVGFMLIVYMLGQRSKPIDIRESRFSTIAGTGALLVALFPTSRPGLPEGAARCGPGASSQPDGCTLLQESIGEWVTAGFHYLGAGVFIGSLALICFFVFAKREELEGNPERKRAHIVAGWAIVAAVVWIAIGSFAHIEIRGWTALLLGEVVSVYAFSVSWLARSRDLLPRAVNRGFELLRL